MSGLSLERGTPIESKGRRFVIVQALDFESILARDPETGQHVRLEIVDVALPATEEPPAASPDLSSLGDEWDEARQRYEIIKPLLAMRRLSQKAVEDAAADAGKHWTTVYRWIRLYRTTGKVSSLLPSDRKDRGKIRIDDAVEAIIQATIGEFYLTRHQRSATSACNEVLRRCRNAGIDPPHPNTVRNRIRAIRPRDELMQRGHGSEARDRFDARPGRYEEAAEPLSVVQIDHTRMDIIAVDSVDRQPIGRPWITLAFDVYSRMVVGFYISFDPPGALATGLCIAHAMLPKEKWLAARGVDRKWPCWGKPRMIHMDNAREFRGDMIQRACEEYGIQINFRPVKVPHYGGHIESMMGTLMQAIHELPGTTFSNPTKRGDQNPDKAAAMTIDEIEAWLAEYICGVYHVRVHSGIETTPMNRYETAILGTKDTRGIGLPERLTNEQRVRLDFMPYVERTIQTAGIVIDNIHYYHDVLRAYINATDPDDRRRKRQFIFKRDPRDISSVYFWDPELKQYSAIPYRNSSFPAISLWELRAAQKRVEEEGRRDVDEAAIFEAHARMRELEEKARRQTKTVRLKREQRKRRPPQLQLVSSRPVPAVAIEDAEVITPYEDLEQR